MNNRAQTSIFDEIIVDNFAGGGGASTGIELATGRVVSIAINHDPDAILMHKTNHPFTEHFQASVWDVDPKEVCRGRPVGLAWFSPDCKHFSKAKGSALVALEAIKAGRKGYTIELNNDYFRDAVGYLKEYEDTDDAAVTMFDLLGVTV